MKYNFLDIIQHYELVDIIKSIYGEYYYNSFKPICGFYEYDNFICEMNYDIIDYPYEALYQVLEDCGYENIIDGEPFENLKSISPEFYKYLKSNIKNIKKPIIFLWKRQITTQLQRYSNYIMSGEECVKEAIFLLENYKPIQNGEGDFVMYFRFKKEFIDNRFFNLFDLDFDIVNSQLKKLKVDKYYKLQVFDTFNGFEEVSYNYIIEHIREHTSYDGEYRFFSFF